jgi:CyaY protein
MAQAAAARTRTGHAVMKAKRVRTACPLAKLVGHCMNELSTMTTAPAATPLPDAEYHRLAHAVLSCVETTVDRWLEDDVIDIDTHRTGGLLELALPNGSKLIINTQPPLQELWLAAKAGGFHFRHVQGRWLDSRDGTEFFEALSRHASAQGGKPLQFKAPG